MTEKNREQSVEERRRAGNDRRSFSRMDGAVNDRRQSSLGSEDSHKEQAIVGTLRDLEDEESQADNGIDGFSGEWTWDEKF